MSFNPDAGVPGVAKGIANIQAGISPIFGDIDQIAGGLDGFVKNNSTILLGLGFAGVIFSFIKGKKKGGGELIFIPSAIIGAAGLYGHFMKNSPTANYAHSYYSYPPFPTVNIPSYAQQYLPPQYNTAITNARNLYSQPLSSYIPNDLEHDVVIPTNTMPQNIQRTVRNVINDSNHVFPHISDVY